ncbi:hypothetical protein Pelo_6403 [Pelomyxa schiedti]|nr:hypothetical protein Pelo_6403 [Pelomyxa schiedti]
MWAFVNSELFGTYIVPWPEWVFYKVTMLEFTPDVNPERLTYWSYYPAYEMMVQALSPIYDGDEFLGAVFVTTKLEAISFLFKNMISTPSGFAMLLTRHA